MKHPVVKRIALVTLRHDVDLVHILWLGRGIEILKVGFFLF